tara:strand:+ start:587 stop:1129 length:543 start_codon:yes stop_codon:yes gene_type:complete
MSSSIIEIQTDDIVDNLNNILTNTELFRLNENLDYLKCFIFYLEDESISNYKKYEIKINNNKITKSELISIILENTKVDSKKFDLTGIYKYEINLDEKDIKDFCNKNNCENYNFITQYKNFEDIKFKPQIELFNDNNIVLLFFTKNSPKPKKTTSKNRTKKVTFKINSEKNSNNKTKKEI